MKVTPYTLLFLAAGLAACYPEQPSDVDTADLDVVTTVFDQAADFQSLTTFVVPDSVIHFVASGDADTLSRDFDNLILTQVRQGFTTLGYTEVSDPATTPPDIVVQVGAISSHNFGYLVYDWWGYWGWYYPWYPAYGPGWGTYYPTTVVPYEYESGTVLMTMLDRRMQDTTNHRIPIIWLGGVTGLLTGSSATTPTRITNGINQVFTQSPYLQKQ